MFSLVNSIALSKFLSYGEVHFCLISVAKVSNKIYSLYRNIYTMETGLFRSKAYLNIDEPYRRNLERFCNLENEHKRRDRLYIIAEILKIAREGSLKTQIMYKANLSFAQLNEYLSFLTRMELIKIRKEENKKVYRITEKGEEYLERYEEISSLLTNNDRKPVRTSITTLR
jgi:predicted transcriptional regulator